MARIDITDDDEPQFGLLDMLFPARLLEQTDYTENPIVSHCERASAGTGRYIATRAFQLALVSAATFFIVSVLNHQFALVLLCIPCFVFMCVRYHLFVESRLLPIDMLSRDHMADLLLTDLGRTGLFLHFLLLNCWNFGLLVFVALPLLLFSPPVVATPDWLIEPWIAFLTLLTLFTQARLASIYQFTLEWEWFAGAPVNRFRPLISLGASLALGAAIIFIDACIVVPLNEHFSNASFIAFPLAICGVSALAFVCVFQRCRRLHANATVWLGRNLDRAMSREDHGLAWPDMLLPSRWANPFKAPHGSLERMRRLDLLLDGFLYGAFFSSILMTSPVIGYFVFGISDFQNDFSWLYLASTIWPVFIMAAIGIYQGESLALEAHPIAPRRVRQALFGIGAASIAIAVAGAAIELLESRTGSVRATVGVFRNYLLNITYGLIALACGVNIAHRRRNSAGLPILFTTLATIAFLVIQSTSQAGAVLISHSVAIPMNLVTRFAVVLILSWLEPLASFICYWFMFKLTSHSLEKLWTSPAAKPALEQDITSS